METPLLKIPYPRALVEGRLVRRYNRFLADVTLVDGSRVVAHCVNTGRMEGLVEPGARVWLSPADNPKRALAWTWELVEIDGVLVGANTAIPNRIVEQLIEGRLLTGLRNWTEFRREKKINDHSRVDFHLAEKRREHFVEVKNCHLVYPDGRGYFPDSVSERATKHLEELIDLVGRGYAATVVFTGQRGDTRAIRPSDIHDPVFADAARRAGKAGVRFRAVMIRPTPEALIVEKVIPVDLKPYALKRPLAWKAANDHRSGWVQIRRSTGQ